MYDRYLKSRHLFEDDLPRDLYGSTLAAIVYPIGASEKTQPLVPTPDLDGECPRVHKTVQDYFELEKCTIDVVNATDIIYPAFFANYVHKNRPVLIKDAARLISADGAAAILDAHPSYRQFAHDNFGTPCRNQDLDSFLEIAPSSRRIFNPLSLSESTDNSSAIAAIRQFVANPLAGCQRDCLDMTTCPSLDSSLCSEDNFAVGVDAPQPNDDASSLYLGAAGSSSAMQSMPRQWNGLFRGIKKWYFVAQHDMLLPVELSGVAWATRMRRLSPSTLLRSSVHSTLVISYTLATDYIVVQ